MKRRDFLKIATLTVGSAALPKLALASVGATKDGQAIKEEAAKGLTIKGFQPGSRVWIAEADTHNEIYHDVVWADHLNIVNNYAEGQEIEVRIRKPGYKALAIPSYRGTGCDVDIMVMQQVDDIL